jgi:hypothetical protein
VKRVTFTGLWLTSALLVGGGTGFGILKATDHGSTPVATPVAAPAPTPSPSITSGVRTDGSHYGSVRDFMLPIPPNFRPGPDDMTFGNDASITPQQLDAQVGQLFPGLKPGDLTSAKGAMEAAHMKDGALRSYAESDGKLDIQFSAFQLDPTTAAKQTADFVRIVNDSGLFRTGPAVAGYPDAHCVLPSTLPGDKLDAMVCLGTVGDTFVAATAGGAVPLDQKLVTALFAQQLDLFKNGLGAAK